MVGVIRGLKALFVMVNTIPQSESSHHGLHTVATLYIVEVVVVVLVDDKTNYDNA